MHPEIEQFSRELLKRRMAELLPEQRDFFNSVWADPIAAEKLQSLIRICERAIERNLIRSSVVIEDGKTGLLVGPFSDNDKAIEWIRTNTDNSSRRYCTRSVESPIQAVKTVATLM